MKLKWTALLGLCLLSIFAFAEEPAPSTSNVMDRQVSVNFKDIDAKSAFNLLGQYSSVPFSIAADVDKKLTYAASNTALRDILEEITTQNDLAYTVENGTVYIRSKNSIGSLAPSDAGGVHLLPLKYANAGDVIAMITPIVPKSEKLISNESSNSLLFVGSIETFQKIRDLTNALDTPPKQILIQGIIIETTETFLQTIGFQAGNISKTSTNNGGVTTAFINNPGPQNPNLGLSAAKIAGRTIDLDLKAAETRGDAKVLSRPKVVTLNNRAAEITSGLTIHVKTLSSTQTAQPGQAPVAVAGGLSQVNAGLSVKITPTIVGDGEVKMKILINASSPDNSQAVDGIPGVQTNSADTMVIVRDDETAIIAGLIKQTRSKSQSGVPLLMDIPILGFLFRSDDRSDQTNELAIFITPSILKNSIGAISPKVAQPSDVLDSLGDHKKPRPDSEGMGFTSVN